MRKNRKACRCYITDIRREILKWEASLKQARHIGHQWYENECLMWINRLRGEIEGIYWCMGVDHNE